MHSSTRPLKPLVNNEAFSKALDILQETTKYGPPNESPRCRRHTRPDTSGRCALSLTGATSHARYRSGTSKVIDKVGSSITPGSKQVLNRETASLRPAPRKPARTRGRRHHAPFASFGGWGGGINAKANAK